MTVQTVTLTDTRSDGKGKFIQVTPETRFIDNDGIDHSGQVKYDYDPTGNVLSVSLPASDAAGNSPTPVLWTIRWVRGNGTDLFTNVDLPASSPTVRLADLVQGVPGVATVAMPVRTVNHAPPDASGDVEVATAGSGAIDNNDGTWSASTSALLDNGNGTWTAA